MTTPVPERARFRPHSLLLPTLRFCALALLPFVLTASAFAVGGGWMNAGLSGDYFNNTSFTTPASFSRKDVRLDFGTNALPPGGSITPAFKTIGATNWSAHWTGQFIPRFTETYTFKVFADDTCVLKVRPTGGSTWTTVINQTTYTGSDSNGNFALTAGTQYDIDIAYTQVGGNWGLRVRWTSPSTPEEVIDCLTQSGINNPDGTDAFIDIVKCARNSWVGINSNPAPTMDAQGWPMGDGGYVFQESLNEGLDVDPLMRGTVAFSFAGSATVSLQGNCGSLTQAYNSGTNTTSGTFSVFNNHWNATTFKFASSHRDGTPTGPGGITNLRLMRPTAVDSTTPYSTTDTTLFVPQMKDAMSHFTVMRFQLVANQQKEWTDRTLPSYFNQASGQVTQPQYGNGSASNNGWSWEHKIMFANETGRDLMLSIPPVASGRLITDTTSYIYYLANLIRYGSDGTNAYTTATANPVYPPLNPNLHVYLELGNELWNFSGVFDTDFTNINSLTSADADAADADFQIFNYDNQSTAKNGSGVYNSLNTWRYRKIILKMIETSNIFRGVFGDGAMPQTSIDPRIRPLYEWQYDNANNTASLALPFADNYFNNADGGAHSATAHPVAYFLWGGGGATYYSAVNGNGLTTLLPDSDFETPTLANGYNQNPTGSSWTFTGTAGIARDAGSGDDIPPPYNGSQAGYVTDTGTMSVNVNFPTTQTSNLYGVSFRAVNRTKTGASSADMENIRIFLDDTTDITAKTYSQGNGYTPPAYDPNNPWKSRNVAWTLSDYYYTLGVAITAGSTHKITIKGMGDITNSQNTNQTAFIDDFCVSSVDKIFTDGIPGGGEANGQPIGSNIQNTMNVEADWARAFGLQELSYEGGWSLGGDDGGSWIQLYAKYGDSRTLTAQATFMNMSYSAGSNTNVFGTYAQWPNWSDYYAQQGLLNVGQYPIVEGIDDRGDNLPVEPANGTAIPATLTLSNDTQASNASASSGSISGAGGWISWNIIAPSTGTYNFSCDAAGGGALQIDIDGQYIGSISNTLNSLTAAPFGALLTKGLHVVRVRSTGGAFTVTQVFAKAGAPTANGPAVEVFTLVNIPGSSTSAAPTSFASGLTVSSLTMGAGLSPTTFGGSPNMSGCLQGTPGGHPSTSLADAKTRGTYFTFNVATQTGKILSTSELDYRFSTDDGANLQTSAAWSTDGVTFNDVTTTNTATSSPAIHVCSAVLSGVTNLQNFTGTVTFRVYVWGIAGYKTAGFGQTGNNAAILYGAVNSSVVAVQASVSTLSAAEGGASTYTVKLSSAPAANVTVTTARASGSSNLSVSGGASLTFTTSNWSTPQTVTIASALDPTDNTNDQATITSSATGYSSASVTATQADADGQSAGDLTGTALPLTGANIGTSSAGDASVRASGVWWVDGSGGGIASTADSFHFENRGASGNFQLVCKMEGLSSSGATPRAGLMLRETNDPGARFVMVSTTTSASGSYHYGSRTSINGTATDTTASGSGSSYNYINAWMMIQRSGDTVTIATSPDDPTWTQIGSVTLTSLAQTVHVGPFSSSGTAGSNTRAALGSFEIVPLTTVFEAESLAVAAQTAGITYRTSSEAGFSGGVGTYFDATAVNQYVTLDVPNIIAGTYDIRIGMKTWNNKGTWQCAISRMDAQGSPTNVGVPIDEYSAGTIYTEIDLGNWSPATTSDKAFRFMVTGKNASSSGYGIDFDYIKMVPQ